MRLPPLSVLLAVAALLAGCEQSTPPRPESAPPAGAAPFSTSLDMKQLMNWVMDSNADVVFAAVGTIITEKGEENIAPKTDEEWTAVRNSAAIVLESANLLMLPGRARDQNAWMEHAQALGARANEVMQAIEVKDSESLFTAASDLYLACSACHAQYMFTETAAQ